MSKVRIGEALTTMLKKTSVKKFFLVILTDRVTQFCKWIAILLDPQGRLRAASPLTSACLPCALANLIPHVLDSEWY